MLIYVPPANVIYLFEHVYLVIHPLLNKIYPLTKPTGFQSHLPPAIMAGVFPPFRSRDVPLCHV